MRKNSITLILLSLLVLTLVETGCNAGIFQNTYDKKLQLLKNEIDKYNSSIPPNELADICENTNNIMKEILVEKESLSSSPEDILSGESNFYISFEDNKNIGAIKYRLIEFGIKEIAMGASKYIYVQYWHDSESPALQELYSMGQGANITSLIHYNVLKSYDVDLILIIDKKYGPESTYIRFSNFYYDGSKWMPYDSLKKSIEKDGWEIKEYELQGMFSLESIKARNRENDYNVEVNDVDVKISVVDNNKNIIDKIELIFSDNNWVYQ